MGQSPDLMSPPHDLELNREGDLPTLVRIVQQDSPSRERGLVLVEDSEAQRNDDMSQIRNYII
jgi:hypothetical protein